MKETLLLWTPVAVVEIEIDLFATELTHRCKREDYSLA